MCREEIADCSERAYSSLSMADAKNLMMFSSDKEALSYAQEVSTASCTCLAVCSINNSVLVSLNDVRA